MARRSAPAAIRISPTRRGRLQLTQYRLDTASIITALLHDTVEDTDATLDEIEELFGKEIRGLVDG